MSDILKAAFIMAFDAIDPISVRQCDPVRRGKMPVPGMGTFGSDAHSASHGVFSHGHVDADGLEGADFRAGEICGAVYGL